MVDSRRGILHIGISLYSFKLVDLPCIIEAQKTLDNKQMFKVADICQVCGFFALRAACGMNMNTDVGGWRSHTKRRGSHGEQERQC